MYLCPTCGAGLVYNPKTENLLCKYCRKKYRVKNTDNMKIDLAKEVRKTEDPGYEVISYKCSHCGAELLTTDETITTFCSFCRSGTIIEKKIIKKEKPDYVIPFSITKEECKDIYVNKVKKSFFAPKNMIETQEVEKIRGIYMPYWIYLFEKHGETNASGMTYSHRSGDYIYFNDYNLKTNVDAECYGISHDATSDFSDRLSEAVAPFDIKERKDFSPAYLSGYYADSENVDSEAYTQYGSDIASKHLSNQLAKDNQYRKYSAKPKVEFDKVTAKRGLFPIYFLATKNLRGDRISYAVINGQTGKIAADIPIDFGKFISFSLFFSIWIFILLNTFLSISVFALVLCAIIFNIISLIIISTENNTIKKYENENEIPKFDDSKNMEKSIKEKQNRANKNLVITLLIIIGIFYSMMFGITFYLMQIGDQVFRSISFIGIIITIVVFLKMIYDVIKTPEKYKSTFLPKLGIISAILIWLFRPADDLYYYGVSLASICMSIISFYSIIERYNILTSRKLPQLGKRGGDENA